MSTVPKSRYLDLAALGALQHMRFATRHRVEGAYSGRHPSKQLGGAGEFVDFREYSGAEDLRRLDWKVLARTGKAFVRLHQEETNLKSILALDVSGSMRFAGFNRKPGGEGSKLDHAKFLATALSHVISEGKDQVGLALLDEQLREFIPFGSTSIHIRQVQSLIEEADTRTSTLMSGSLRSLFERVQGHGILILLSDFLSEDLQEVFSTVSLFRHRRWEVIVLHLVHPEEERLPELDALSLVGLEGEGLIACSPHEIGAEYRRRFQTHLESVRRFALAAGCDYRMVSTGIDYLKTLGGFLVERSG